MCEIKAVMGRVFSNGSEGREAKRPAACSGDGAGNGSIELALASPVNRRPLR